MQKISVIQQNVSSTDKAQVEQTLNSLSSTEMSELVTDINELLADTPTPQSRADHWNLADKLKQTIAQAAQTTPVTSPTPAPSPSPVPTPSPSPAPAPSTSGNSEIILMDGLPAVDLSKEPAPKAGSASLEVFTANDTPRNKSDNTGDFRVTCNYSHMANNDPIVYPNDEGASHHHTFFGNTSADHKSDVNNMHLTGNSTCAGGTANRSAYWVPSMIDTATNTPLPPSHIMVYYKTQVANAVQHIPKGLRMIAKPHVAGRTTRYTCNDDYNTRQFDKIPACGIGSTVQYKLDFPNCWDGVNLDSPNHTSHMAFTTWSQACPASHPVRIPNVTFNVHYKVTSDISKWRLASDKGNEPSGYSIHGDWVNGWDPEISKAFVNNCLKASKDCHAYLLGDGRTLRR